MEFRRRLFSLVLDELIVLVLMGGVTTAATVWAIQGKPRHWWLAALGTVIAIRQTYRLWAVHRNPPKTETLTLRTFARQAIIGLAMGVAWGEISGYFFRN